MQYFLLFLYGFLILISPAGFSSEPALLSQLEKVTNHCQDKTFPSWLGEIKTLETLLYEKSQGLDKEAFRQMIKAGSAQEQDRIYWLYELFGQPYKPNKNISLCYANYYEFKQALSETNIAAADNAMIMWQACTWDFSRQHIPLAAELETCYVEILRANNYKSLFLTKETK